MHLANPELIHSKSISIMSKLCLKFLYNVVSIDSLIMEKSNDYSLIIHYLQSIITIFQRTGSENNSGIDRRVESNSLTLIFQKVYSRKIISYET
jgi:hypothetical protein